jgi:molybdate-binding protein
MLPGLTPDQLKALSHPTRVAILRALMNEPATLSQLGEQFESSAAHIRHHLKSLQDCGLAEPLPDHPQHNHLEKYYRASQPVLIARLTILPASPTSKPALTISSMDSGISQVQSAVNAHRAAINLQVLPMNSLDGLMLLRQGVCQMATCHLLDSSTREYNRSFVRHIFPGRQMAIIPLYGRVEGLIVKPGNPFQIRNLDDLLQPGLRFINRELGSGIRIWLDQALKERGLEPHQIQGYHQIADSHARVAQAIANGLADAGLGIASQARESGLGFIPLFEEPYELVAAAELVDDPIYVPFFEHLNSKAFRTTIQAQAGYTDLPASGQVETIT